MFPDMLSAYLKATVALTEQATETVARKDITFLQGYQREVVAKKTGCPFKHPVKPNKYRRFTRTLFW